MAATFKTSFKNEFFEALKPLGFQKVKKSAHTYLARVINGEIIEAVTFFSGYKPTKGWEAYNIEIGIASIYSDVLDMSTKAGSCGWFRPLGEYYGATLKPNGFEQLKPLNSIPSIEFQKGDEQGMLDSIRELAECTAGAFDTDIKTVTDIDSYIDWLVLHHIPRLRINIDEGFAASRLGKYAGNEGLLWLLSKRERSVEEEYRRYAEHDKEMYAKRGRNIPPDDELTEGMTELVYSRFRLDKEPELKQQALAAAETRRRNNTEMLRIQGFEL